MTARKQRMLEIMQHCLLDGEFCDTCPNVNEGYEGCRAQKKCALRKALENIAPTAAVHENGLCAYTDVAAGNALGEYI